MQRNYFLAKLFVPLIKGSVSPQFYAIFGKLNFWRNIDRLGPYKNGENLYYLNLCYENIFWQNYLFHSSKEVFVHNFRQFLENWIFEGISTGADLIKMVKICIISIGAKKIFFDKIICSTHQRKFLSTILHDFWKIDFLKEYRQAQTLQKWWNLYYLNLCQQNIFWQNYLFHSSKEVFVHNFSRFSENWIFEGISTGADLTKMVNIWTILNCAKKLFFGKLKIFIILICAKKIFFGKIIYSYFSKEEFLHNFRHFSENWIFEGISTGADLTKMVKICIISIFAKKIFFGKIICSTHQRKCFSTMLRNFGKLNFWRNIDRLGPYKNGENLYYLNLC